MLKKILNFYSWGEWLLVYILLNLLLILSFVILMPFQNPNGIFLWTGNIVTSSFALLIFLAIIVTMPFVYVSLVDQLKTFFSGGLKKLFNFK